MATYKISDSTAENLVKKDNLQFIIGMLICVPVALAVMFHFRGIDYLCLGVLAILIPLFTFATVKSRSKVLKAKMKSIQYAIENGHVIIRLNENKRYDGIIFVAYYFGGFVPEN